MKTIGQAAYEHHNRRSQEAPDWSALVNCLRSRWQRTAAAVLVHVGGHPELLDVIPAVAALRAALAEAREALAEREKARACACDAWAQEIDHCQEMARVVLAADAERDALKAENAVLRRALTGDVLPSCTACRNSVAITADGLCARCAAICIRDLALRGGAVIIAEFTQGPEDKS